MSKNDTKSPLLVKNKDAKKASLWHDFADKRFIKQHGGYDIPEGDNHAIPKYQSPLDQSPTSPEETKEVLSDIEKEIQQLKLKDELHSPQREQPFSHREDYSDDDQY